MKRIVFLLRYWAVYGGGETVTISLANEMVKRNHEVSIVYLWDNYRDSMPFIDKRIKRYRIRGEKGEDLKVDNPLLSIRLEEYIISNQVDFIINQWWLAEIAYKGTVKTKAILVKCHHISVQGTWTIKVKNIESLIKYILGPIYIRISKKLQIKAIEKFYHLSDYVVFLAPSYVEEFKSLTRLDYNSLRLLAIFNPLVYDQCLPLEEYRNKKNIALFVGRMQDAQKRIRLLLRIWREIEKSGKCKIWKLKLVGTGDDLNSAMKLAKDLELKSISFEGYQQPDSYYKEAKIFMMTSQTEGLPMTLIEAKQNLLCPIVMDTFPSLHDILTNNKDGIIVSDNIDDYVNTFISVANNPSIIECIGCNHDNISRFSVVSIVDEWEKLFNNSRKYIK